MIPSNRAIQFKEYLRLAAVTASGAMTEVVCYADTGHLYAGVMTGNTIQFGWLFGAGEWAKVFPLIWVITFFVLGCGAGQVMRIKHLSLTFIYSLMLALLIIASVLRLEPPLRLLLELPVLSFATAIQAVNFPKFDGIGLQTVVTTNNIVKFITGLVTRYIYPPADSVKRPSSADVWIPGICWITFIISAGIGGALVAFTQFPLAGSVLIVAAFLGINICLLKQQDV